MQVSAWYNVRLDRTLPTAIQLCEHNYLLIWVANNSTPELQVSEVVDQSPIPVLLARGVNWRGHWSSPWRSILGRVTKQICLCRLSSQEQLRRLMLRHAFGKTGIARVCRISSENFHYEFQILVGPTRRQQQVARVWGMVRTGRLVTAVKRKVGAEERTSCCLAVSRDFTSDSDVLVHLSPATCPDGFPHAQYVYCIPTRQQTSPACSPGRDH